MVKKNILGIAIIILVITAFCAGYLVGKQSGKAPVQQGQMMAGDRPAKQTKKPDGQHTESDDAQSDTSGTPKQIPVGRTFYGTAAPYSEANVRAKQGETITMLKVKEGDSVAKGEVIVRFDDTNTKLELEKALSSKNAALQEVQQAKSNFNTVQTNFKRNKRLAEENIISKQKMDEVTNQLESARSALNSAKENVTQAEAQISLTKNSLKDFQVTAPISGIIKTKNYNLHEVYKTGDVIYNIVSTDKIYVEVDIPETYISHIREQMSVTVSFDAFEGREFPAVADTILPSGTSDNRTFIVKVIVANPDHRIKPGMFARINIVLEGSKAESP